MQYDTFPPLKMSSFGILESHIMIVKRSPPAAAPQGLPEETFYSLRSLSERAVC